MSLIAGTILLTLACTLSQSSASSSISAQATPVPPEPIYKTDIFFWVEIPENTPAGEKIILEVVDEVTGIEINPKYFEMVGVDATHFGFALQVQVGSIIKYRYVREGENRTREITADGQPIRYRMYYADGPGEVHDLVARWEDTGTQVVTGRLLGKVVEGENDLPVSNLLVSAGGKQVVTAMDGTFTITGLIPGQHLVTIYAMDGFYQPYKQSAMIAAEAATPLSIKVQRAEFVEVTFNVRVPENTVPAVPLRMSGNLSQLGNTFSDLGGTSGLPGKMPQLIEVSPDLYSIIIALPAGADIRYKYTQGDGFWNAEHKSDTSFNVRQLIIPSGRTTYIVDDVVYTWQSSISAPMWFDLTTPSNTPNGDDIYVQFGLFNWMTPLPMWQVSANRWAFEVLSPTNIAGDLAYRYCRNAQCGDYIVIATDEDGEFRTTETNLSQSPTVSDTIEYWYRLSNEKQPATVLSDAINKRGEHFIAGISFMPGYHPTWETQTSKTLGKLVSDNANTVIFTPTWTITESDPPLFQQQLGQDIPLPELGQNVLDAYEKGLFVIVYPQLQAGMDMQEWWTNTPRTGTWWKIWFEQYRNFILNYADLAQRYQAGVLILGGEWLLPAMPNGKLISGDSSGVPSDVNGYWAGLIQEIRGHYSGVIAWQLPYGKGLDKYPQFIQGVDQIFVHWGVPLATWSEADLSEIQSRAGILLDEQVLPFKEEINKPVILSVAYPSATGGVTNCITLSEDEKSCVPFYSLSPFLADNPEISLDLQEQVEVYNAILAAVNQRDWVDGFISEGYFLPVGLEDKSISIHGKPTEAVLRYWFQHFLGK